MEFLKEEWIEFMESPIAVLEDYGLPLRAINRIEEKWGIYIKDIQMMDEAAFRELPDMGDVFLKALKASLNLYLIEIREHRKINGIDNGYRTKTSGIAG